jgi:hypothetical protein
LTGIEVFKEKKILAIKMLIFIRDQFFGNLFLARWENKRKLSL